jgi:hypothetical protein
MIRLIAEDSRVAVLAFIRFGDGRGLAVAGTFENFSRRAVSGNQSKERISDKDILEGDFDVFAAPGAAPIVKRDKNSERRVHRG